MKKIYFKTKNKILFEIVKTACFDSNFCEILARNKETYPILEDKEDKLVFNTTTILSKPFSFTEFIKNIKFDKSFHIKKFIISPNQRKITYDKQSTILTEIEFKIIELLYNSTNGISLDEIQKNVLHYSNTTQSKSYATHICNLRKKLTLITGKSNILVFNNNKYKINF